MALLIAIAGQFVQCLRPHSMPGVHFVRGGALSRSWYLRWLDASIVRAVGLGRSTNLREIDVTSAVT